MTVRTTLLSHVKEALAAGVRQVIFGGESFSQGVSILANPDIAKAFDAPSRWRGAGICRSHRMGKGGGKPRCLGGTVHEYFQ